MSSVVLAARLNNFREDVATSRFTSERPIAAAANEVEQGMGILRRLLPIGDVDPLVPILPVEPTFLAHLQVIDGPEAKRQFAPSSTHMLYATSYVTPFMANWRSARLSCQVVKPPPTRPRSEGSHCRSLYRRSSTQIPGSSKD